MRSKTSRPSRDSLLPLLADATTAAPALLGCLLVREGKSGRRCGLIVETEAYLGDDPASHSFGGMTRRNRAMFAAPGTAYVYRLHRSHCLNVVTGESGRGEAVLVRAIEPVEGIAAMIEARARATVGGIEPTGRLLTNGPGKLCQAFDIDLSFDGISLLDPMRSGERLSILRRRRRPEVETSARIGISRARDRKLRFFIPDNEWTSR